MIKQLLPLLFFVMTSTIVVQAQNYVSDFLLIIKQDKAVTPKKIKKPFIAYTPPYWIYKFAEKKIIPQVGISERYEIKLRQFSKSSFKEFGLIKGYFMSIDRINRTGRLGYIDFPSVRVTASGSIVDLPKYYKLK